MKAAQSDVPTAKEAQGLHGFNRDLRGVRASRAKCEVVQTCSQVKLKGADCFDFQKQAPSLLFGEQVCRSRAYEVELGSVL